MDEQELAELEEGAEPIEPITWRAPEFEYHTKKAGWYALFVLGLLALVAVAVLTKQWLTIGVFVVMGASMLVYTARRPKDLEYAIDEDGISIDGKHHAFEEFQSFSQILTEGWHGLDLDPVRRFMPRVSVALNEETGQQVINTLSTILPQVDRDQDIVERISRKLKF